MGYDLTDQPMEGGDDGANSDDGFASSRIRELCLQQLKNFKTRSKIFTERDIQSFSDTRLSDRALDGSTDKESVLQGHLTIGIPKIMMEITKLETQFVQKIGEAQRKKWISKSSAKRWLDERLTSDKMLWWEKKHWMEQVFPTYYRNWEKLAQEVDKSKQLIEKLSVTEKDIPELKEFNAKEFSNDTWKHPRRKEINDKAYAALLAYQKNRIDPRTLYLRAKNQLQGAVDEHILARSKMGPWLRRIFESQADPKRIEDFVLGKGKMPLDKIIGNWREAKGKYDDVEADRKEAGWIPPFHFVKLDVFLEWDYKKRMTYIQEANTVMKTPHAHPLLLDLRREVSTHDWASAAYILEKAKHTQFSKSDREHLKSLQHFIRHHRPPGLTPEELAEKRDRESPPSEESIISEIESVLVEVPQSPRTLYRDIMLEGDYEELACLRSVTYNLDWATRHGYTDAQRLLALREGAKEETREIAEHGHKGKKELENVDLAAVDQSDKEFVVRNHDDGTWAATYVHVDSSSIGSFHESIRKNKTNHNFKYWVIADFTDAPYEQMLHVSRNVNHRFKSLKRRLDYVRSLKKKETPLVSTNSQEVAAKEEVMRRKVEGMMSTSL